MGCRFWHTTVTSQCSSRMRQLFTFGGCPGAPESHTSGSWPKMANTVIVEIGTIFCLLSYMCISVRPVITEGDWTWLCDMHKT